jgi:23S rRNA pseudouridine2605 synthase
VARVISKLGLASRTQAAEWVRAGRVQVNDRVVQDAEFPVRQGLDRIRIDGLSTAPAGRLVLMVKKPRGRVTTTNEEQGRDTVDKCFAGGAAWWRPSAGSTRPAKACCCSPDPAWAARI